MLARATALVSAAALLLGAAGCSKKRSSGWLVGEHGLMVRIDDGESERYAPGVDSDLWAIACRGDSEAWTVGAGGTVLWTTDGGAEWTAVDVGTDRALRSVATASGDAVWIAGDGTLLFSPDGQSFERIEAVGDFASVATDTSGRIALVAAVDGSILRVAQADPIQVLPPGPAIHGIGLTPDGETAVAVGDDGTVLWSDDGGETWTELDAGTDATLRAVRISADGTFALAVGDAIVRIEDRVASSRAVSDSLWALHLEADGHGMAVGAGGTVWDTEDLGSTWSTIDAGTSGTFFGVDDLHGEPHL